MVIILAAGRGSRSGLSDISKCSVPLVENGMCSVSRLICQMSVYETKFLVVVGYQSESVINKVSDDLERYLNKTVDVTYVYNDRWGTIGSGFSLAICYPYLSSCPPDESVYIFEGDSVYSDDNIKALCSSPGGVLVRDPNYLSVKSVCVLSLEDHVVEFVYDTAHQLDFKGLSRCVGTCTLYESMQCWKLVSGLLTPRLAIYTNKKLIAGHANPLLITNLAPINDYALMYKIPLIFSPSPDSWVNLNTEEDRETAKLLISERKI